LQQQNSPLSATMDDKSRPQSRTEPKREN
jgi:hypothetical protein